MVTSSSPSETTPIPGLPAPQDRPDSSDALPTGQWLKQLEEDGYRGYTWSARGEVIPLVLAVVVLVATLACAWLFWDRIPDQVPLHTGADGEVTRWGEKTPGNVLMGPLVGGGGMLVALTTAMLVGRFMKPRPASNTVAGETNGATALGTLVRQAATTTALIRGVGWGGFGFLLAIVLLEVPRWVLGYDVDSPSWIFGVAVLGLLVFPYLACRQVRPRIDDELRALEIPLGPETERELHAWRYVMVIDDRTAPLWVGTGSPSTNYTVNIAKPAGRVMAFGFLVLMTAFAMFLVLTPLISG